MSYPLSTEQLESIAREARLLERDALGWWALGALGALMPPGRMWCLVDRRKFLRCGGPGWRELGYDVNLLEGREWLDFIAGEEEESLSAMDDTLMAGRVLTGFVNRYHLADRSGTRAVEWHATPWSHATDGVSMALGELL